LIQVIEPIQHQKDNKNLTFNICAWHYKAENNVYWQIWIGYCFKPEIGEFENLAIYIPGEYVIVAPNGDGTFSCTYNTTGKVNDYTVNTATNCVSGKYGWLLGTSTCHIR
jgi:hypothetical protein